MKLGQFAHADPSFSGVALAVRTPTLSRDGGAGAADRSTRRPLTTTAGIRIASVTKTFTAAPALRLVEDRKLFVAAGATRPDAASRRPAGGRRHTRVRPG